MTVRSSDTCGTAGSRKGFTLNKGVQTMKILQFVCSAQYEMQMRILVVPGFSHAEWLDLFCEQSSNPDYKYILQFVFI